jgi:hypothetical protein
LPDSRVFAGGDEQLNHFSVFFVVNEIQENQASAGCEA